MSRRKTEDEKKLTGTSRKRGSDLSPIPLGEIPKPESYLPKPAHSIYNRIMRHLATTNQLDKIDSLYVSAVAQDFYLLEKYSKIINSTAKGKGAIQKFSNGTSNVSTAYTIVRHCMERIRSHNIQLGLNVRSRENLTTFRERKKNVKKQSNLAKVLGGK